MSTSTVYDFKSIYTKNFIWDGGRWVNQKDILKRPNDQHLNRLKTSDPFKDTSTFFTETL